MPLFIKDDRTAELVARLAKERGVTRRSSHCRRNWTVFGTGFAAQGAVRGFAGRPSDPAAYRRFSMSCQAIWADLARRLGAERGYRSVKQTPKNLLARLTPTRPGSYSCVKINRAILLYKSDDFSQTDLA